MIFVVVPTIRPKSFKIFKEEWKDLFEKHDVHLIKVEDGKHPKANGRSVKNIMGKYSDLIYNFNDGVRNLGFALAWKLSSLGDIIISLDDDVLPYGDTIQGHIDALNMRQPISWLSTADKFTRGFPYQKREEAEVVLSHGVWEGVADWDSPTQLVNGERQEINFYKGVIPKGVLFPLCAMNFAFKAEIMPFIYQAPMLGNINRFADIWGGIECKKDIDDIGFAVVTGYAKVFHNRASNVFANLKKEVIGLEMNENYGKHKYFKLFFQQRKRWINFIKNA